MSKEMLDKAYETNLQITNQAFELMKENSEMAMDAWEKYIPKMYTPEEVKKQAETLYEFVMKKD